MIELTNAVNFSINGKVFDFIGVTATIDCVGNIINVTDNDTGADLTEEYKKKYGQESNET